MLTKIGDALGGWTPRAGGGDPLGVIRAGWIELVGAEVARAAQPVALAHDTLVVVTSSSSWSHQLAFLEPQILRGIHERLPAGVVVRLRFRVGTIRVRPRGLTPKSGPATSGRAPAPARPAPRTAHEALARFRTTVERVRSAHRQRGGAFCTLCAAPVRQAGHCVPCADWERAALHAQCQRLLFDAPWLRPEDVLEALPRLDAVAYDGIRRQLLRSWRDEMALARRRAALPRPIAPDATRLRKIASSYVLLETKIDPNRLEMDSPIRRNALGDLYEFIRSIEVRAAERP